MPSLACELGRDTRVRYHFSHCSCQADASKTRRPRRSSCALWSLPGADGRAVARTDMFSATAARMSAFKAASSMVSPSWMSMARLTLPSRLALKRRDGSASEAPLAKVSFTTDLYVSPVQMMPACSHTGTPRHFHSSTTSGSASLMRLRTRASVSPRQSLSSLILASISWEGESPPCPSFEPLFVIFMVVSTPSLRQASRCPPNCFVVRGEPVTVIAAVSLFDGVMLMADSRVTVTPKGRRAYYCDIAQKIFPLTANMALAFSGDV